MGRKSNEKLTVHLTDSNARPKIYNQLLHLLGNQEECEIRPIIFLCIGSDRYTGDALGPLVGSYLAEHTSSIVYGTLDNPIHAGNLVDTIQLIRQQYYQPIIIAIDACLGKNHEIGNIEVWEGGLQAGIAVGNRLPRVGHISVIGVVNAGGQIGYLDLQSTPLSIVMKLSRIISETLAEAIHVICQHPDYVMPAGELTIGE